MDTRFASGDTATAAALAAAKEAVLKAEAASEKSAGVQRDTTAQILKRLDGIEKLMAEGGGKSKGVGVTFDTAARAIGTICIVAGVTYSILK